MSEHESIREAVRRIMINGQRIVATIEARMTSSRLPGKVMLPLAGRPVMAHMIERHRRSAHTDEIVVATTTNATDDCIAELCATMHCSCFRGSEKDVLGRIVGAGNAYGADLLVQSMADSPLIDWRIVDRLLEMHIEGDYDCTSNEFEDTYPIGLDMRVYSFLSLREADRKDTDPAYREHAGYSIRSRPARFRLRTLRAEGAMHWPALRLTLDTWEDYRLISAVYDELYPVDADFSAEDVVAFLRARPDLVAVNSDVLQKGVEI